MYSSVEGLAPGRIQSAKYDTIMAPSPRGLTTRNPVIYCHGAAGDGRESSGSTGLPSVRTLLKEFAKFDHVSACPTQTQTWGNSTSDAAITAAINHIRANGFGATGPAILFGASHGAACALRYAFLHPASVAAVLLAIPVVDVQYTRAQNFAGLRSAIDAAWGVTYPAALPANANPAGFSVSVPILAWYASNDTYSTNIAAWAALQTSAQIQNVGATGHTDTTIGAYNPVTAVQWCQDLL